VRLAVAWDKVVVTVVVVEAVEVMVDRAGVVVTTGLVERKTVRVAV